MSLRPIFASRMPEFSIAQIGMINSIVGFLIGLFNAGLTILLIFAIFGERAKPVEGSE